MLRTVDGNFVEVQDLHEGVILLAAKGEQVRVTQCIVQPRKMQDLVEIISPSGYLKVSSNHRVPVLRGYGDKASFQPIRADACSRGEIIRTSGAREEQIA